MTNIGFVSKDASIREIIEALINEPAEEIELVPGTEISTRILDGHVGSVSLHVARDGFQVTVYDHNGYIIFVRVTETRAVAAQLYLHPFSLPEVQSLWDAEGMLH